MYTAIVHVLDLVNPITGTLCKKFTNTQSTIDIGRMSRHESRKAQAQADDDDDDGQDFDFTSGRFRERGYQVMSSNHARIEWSVTGEYVYLTDLDSTNGTIIDRIDEPQRHLKPRVQYRIMNGDVITFGKVITAQGKDPCYPIKMRAIISQREVKSRTPPQGSTPPLNPIEQRKRTPIKMTRTRTLGNDSSSPRATIYISDDDDDEPDRCDSTQRYSAEPPSTQPRNSPRRYGLTEEDLLSSRASSPTFSNDGSGHARELDLGEEVTTREEDDAYLFPYFVDDDPIMDQAEERTKREEDDAHYISYFADDEPIVDQAEERSKRKEDDAHYISYFADDEPIVDQHSKFSVDDAVQEAQRSDQARYVDSDGEMISDREHRQHAEEEDEIEYSDMNMDDSEAENSAAVDSDQADSNHSDSDEDQDSEQSLSDAQDQSEGSENEQGRATEDDKIVHYRRTTRSPSIQYSSLPSPISPEQQNDDRQLVDSEEDSRNQQGLVARLIFPLVKSASPMLHKSKSVIDESEEIDSQTHSHLPSPRESIDESDPDERAWVIEQAPDDRNETDLAPPQSDNMEWDMSRDQEVTDFKEDLDSKLNSLPLKESSPSFSEPRDNGQHEAKSSQMVNEINTTLLPTAVTDALAEARTHVQDAAARLGDVSVSEPEGGPVQIADKAGNVDSTTEEAALPAPTLIQNVLADIKALRRRRRRSPSTPAEAKAEKDDSSLEVISVLASLEPNDYDSDFDAEDPDQDEPSEDDDFEPFDQENEQVGLFDPDVDGDMDDCQMNAYQRGDDVSFVSVKKRKQAIDKAEVRLGKPSPGTIINATTLENASSTITSSLKKRSISEVDPNAGDQYLAQRTATPDSEPTNRLQTDAAVDATSSPLVEAAIDARPIAPLPKRRRVALGQVALAFGAGVVATVLGLSAISDVLQASLD